MRLDAIAITSTNIRETVKFYELLGFKFGDFADSDQHVEPIVANGAVRLMIDTQNLIEDIYKVKPMPPTHPSFAMLCDTPREVDEVVGAIKDKGYQVVKEPYDAFWGQRYATVRDPDGYMVDIFATL